MIKAGAASDKENAISLYKTKDDGTFAAGMTLAGFGTQPIPGAICDDAIQHAVNFAALHMQKAMDVLLNKSCSNMDYAKALLTKQLGKVNDGIAYFGRHVGQGLYLAGAICYIAQERFICLPFGGAYACYWDGKEITTLKNKALSEEESPYIQDALGGVAQWTAEFDEGDFPQGTKLLCMTELPPERLLPTILDSLGCTSQVLVPVSIYKGLERKELPLAALDISQTPNIAKEDHAK